MLKRTERQWKGIEKAWLRLKGTSNMKGSSKVRVEEGRGTNNGKPVSAILEDGWAHLFGMILLSLYVVI